MRSIRMPALVCCTGLLCGLFGWTGYHFWVRSRTLSHTAAVYRERAERGDANAEYELGEMYFRGAGVPRDYAEAIRWTRMAADEGYAKAASALGYFYYGGLGVGKSYSDAVHWFSIAAAKGDAVGELDLGYMFRRGQGVPQDDRQAFRWISQSASRGMRMPSANLPTYTERDMESPRTMHRRQIGIAKLPIKEMLWRSPALAIWSSTGTACRRTAGTQISGFTRPLSRAINMPAIHSALSFWE